MRDDGAIAAGQGGGKHASDPAEWPMSDREDTAEDKMEVSASHRAGNRFLAEAKGAQLLP